MKKGQIYSTIIASVLALGGLGAASMAEARDLHLGYIMSKGSPADQGASLFKKIVEEKTHGDLNIVIHPNGLLGGERDLWEGMEIGSVDFAITGVGPISFFTPEYSGVQMYYAINDNKHLDAVFDGEIGEEIRQALLKAKGGLVLDWWHRGARHITANKPIRTPADLKDLKLRTPEGELYLKAWTALGANPTPMALGELFMGLEQGVVDGQENPLEMIATQSFNEVQSHVSLTGHQVQPFLFAVRKRTLDDLTDEQQAIIREAALAAGDFEKRLVAESEETYKKELADKGMTIVDDVDRDAFKKIVHKTALQLESEGLWKEGLYDRIQEAK